MNIKSRHIRIPPEVIISPEMRQLLLQLLEIDPRNRIDLGSLLSEAERLFAAVSPPHDNEIPMAPSQTNFSIEKNGKVDSGQELSVELQKPTGSPTISPRLRETEEQPALRPSGIALGLSTSSGGSMRRVRSRDQISGAGHISSSPPNVGVLSAQAPAPVSTSPANQRPSSVTSATATMILALANSGGPSNPSTPSAQLGTSPSQGSMVPNMHRRSNSGDRRASTGDLSSPVMKALSIPKGDQTERFSNTSEGYKYKESPPNSQLLNSRGSSMVFGLVGPIDHGRGGGGGGGGISSSRSQLKPYEGLKSDEGEDADDFVLVEQTPSHPWRAVPTDLSQSQSNPGIAHWYANSTEQPTSGTDRSNIGGGAGTSAIGQEETMLFNANVKRCTDTIQMVTAITALADQIVRDSLHPKLWKNEKKRHSSSERESKDVKSAGVPDDDSVGSYSSGDRPRGRSFDATQIPELLAPPFSLYLHVMTFLHDAIQRTLKYKQMTSVTDSNETQIDILIEGLSKRFEQILLRAENCKKFIHPNQSLPVPERLLYQFALQQGQEASVDELLGNFVKASERYRTARLLIECVLMTASESSDRKVLQQFIQMFTDQLTLCEESKSIL